MSHIAHDADDFAIDVACACEELADWIQLIRAINKAGEIWEMA